MSAASEESSFLQGDYSSQLICVLRRQTTGQRLITLLQALKNPNLCPGLADLEAGKKYNYRVSQKLLICFAYNFLLGLLIYK